MSNRYRFPPSPTGHLHVGNVRTALYNWLLARQEGGEFILRIEDTDVERSTRESEEALLRDLEWLGIDWDEGPGAGGPFEPYRQSERGDTYRELAARLLEEGLAYYCFCSPDELKAERERALKEGRPPRYSGKCRSIAPKDARRRVDAGEPAALRFRVEDGPAVEWEDLVHGHLSVALEEIGDFVIVRSEGPPAYNFAVTVDDAQMRVTRVLRGDDHISNTPRQILLYSAMGFGLPEFGHLPMILGPDGSRLSKRHGATSVDEFRARGFLPEALINYLALLGWNPGDEREIFTPRELIEIFSLDRVNKSAAIFSVEKLTWINGKHMRRLANHAGLEGQDRLLKLSIPFFKEKGYMTQIIDDWSGWQTMITGLFANSTEDLCSLAEESRIIFEYNPNKSVDSLITNFGTMLDDITNMLELLYKEVSIKTALDKTIFKTIIKSIGDKTGLKGKYLYMPIRIALTGEEHGPELLDLVEAYYGAFFTISGIGPYLNDSLPNPIIGIPARIKSVLERLRSKT